MKNKSIIFLVIFIWCIAGLLKNSQSSVGVTNPNSDDSKTTKFHASSPEVILKNDLEKLEKNLSPETLKDDSWASVNDYSISAKKLVNGDNSKHLFKLTNGSIANLAACLKKNFCGMERRSDNDAYFDESRTPGHILLERDLSIMIEGLRINPDLQAEIDWDLIKEFTNSANENIQVLAVELLKNFGAFSSDAADLFKTVDNYKGNAKAEALAELSNNSPNNSPNDRLLLLDSLEKSFAGDDPNTVISVVLKLNKMNLSNKELAKVSKHLCHYKENGSDNPNWKMIKYDMGKFLIDLEKICSN